MEQWKGILGTSVRSNSAGPSWSFHRRGDAQRASYIRAHGSDRAPTPRQRVRSIYNISKISGHTMTSSTQPEDEDMIAPTDTGLAEARITKSVDFTGPIDESSTTRSAIRSEVPRPSPVVLPTRVFVGQSGIERYWITANTSQVDDSSSIEGGSPRIPRLTLLPSLFSMFNFNKRRSMALAPRSRPTITQSSNSTSFEFTDRNNVTSQEGRGY